MYCSYVEIEYIATNFSPARTDLALKLLTPVLWSGRLAGVADPHSDQPLARGFLPFWSIRGTCEIRGSTANLWYAAAKALVFAVLTVCYPNPLFVGHLSGLCTGAKSLGPHP